MKPKAVIFTVLLLLLVGCWDIEEADRLDYVHGLGIDYKDGKITVHLQIVNLGNLGNPEVSPQTENQVTIATETGPNISSAVFNIYKSAQRRIYWGHDTFILLSEEALKENKLKETLDLIDRFPKTRYRIRVFAAKGDIKKLMKVAPIFNSSPIFTKITDLNNTYEQNSRIKPISIRELIISLDEPGHNSVIPTVDIAENTWETEKEPIEMIKSVGVALATPDHFNGFILGDDVNGLRWLQKDSKRNNIPVFKDGKPVSEVVIIKPKVSYNIETKGEHITFHINIRGKGTVNEMIEDVDPQYITDQLEESIRREVMHTFKKALEIDADIYRLSEKLYRRKLKTWKKLEKNGEIKLTEDSLKVTVNIELYSSRLSKTKPTVE